MGQERVLNQLATNLQKKIFNGISANETKNPYKLEGLATSTSGYSFGWYHWDMVWRGGENDPEYKILRDAVNQINQEQWDSAVRNAGLDPVSVTKEKVLEEIPKTKGTPNNMVSAVRGLINEELARSSDAIDDLTATQTKKFEVDVYGFITTLKPEHQAYANNNDLFKVNYCDLKNQGGQGAINRFKSFLNSIQGELGLDDLVRFRVTEMGSASDQLRRFSNMIEQEGVNNISLTQEDIRFLLSELEGLLGERYKAIISNPDNWGIRNLISKAYTLWADRSANFYGIDYWQRLQMNILIPAQLQSYTTATSLPPPVPRGDPLILDLDGDGVETFHVNDGAYFDHDGNGFAERTGWAGSDDGLLVWDRNGDGVINNGRELFGDQTILKTGARATNGFQALAEWDDNVDGKIDFSDSVWSNLKVWQDFDGDGYSSGDELYALNDLGITALNTGYASVNITDPSGNIQTLAGTFKKADGIIGQMNNYALRRDTTYTIANEWL
ncbi:hypothetical protein FJZ33_01215, partial [Candidatus Poribacteria bacterium]|nr:hypothetical protein [Candidatus Poribacteria bacterium]